MKAISAALALILAVAAAVVPVGAGSRATDVTVEQAHTLIQQNSGKADFVVLDVRTLAEFKEGHVEGAILLDVSAPDFEKRLSTLGRGTAYLVYCRSGNRSSRAVQAMERLGFRSIYHMNQGILGWQQKKLPLSPPS